MIKVENWSPENLVRYGTLIGEAFAASPGIAENLPHEDIVKAFRIITEYYYRSGVLYATSENMEGFLAYWDKHTKQPLRHSLWMVFKMLKEVPLKSLLRIAVSSDEQFTKIYRREPDYIAVSMVVVLQAYQGKGFMKKVLEVPFAQARERACPCVLDTDSEKKVIKYEHCGMKEVARKDMGHGITLYTMEYR